MIKKQEGGGGGGGDGQAILGWMFQKSKIF